MDAFATEDEALIQQVQSQHSTAELRHNLEKAINKNRKLSIEYDKVVANMTVLEETLRTRMDLIIRLTDEKEHLSADINTLNAKLTESESKIESILTTLKEKDEECKRLTALNNGIVVTFNTKCANEALMTKMEPTNKTNEQDLSKRIESLQKETESLRQENEKQRIELDDLKNAKEAELESIKKDFEESRVEFERQRELIAEQHQIQIKELKQSLEVEKQAQISEMKAELASERQRVSEMCALQKRNESEFSQVRAELLAKEEALNDQIVLQQKFQENFEAEKAKLEELREELNSREIELRKREANFDEEAEKLKEKEESLAKREETQRKMELELSQKASALEIQEKRLVLLEVEIKQREEALVNESAALKSQNFEYATDAEERLNQENEIRAEVEKMREEFLKQQETTEIEHEKSLEALRDENERKLRELKAEREALVAEKEEELKRVRQRLAKLKKKHSQTNSMDLTHVSYLKKVLLQFFLQDGKTRESLIPMILSLVGCDEAQIQGCVKIWKESNQLINQTWQFSPF